MSIAQSLVFSLLQPETQKRVLVIESLFGQTMREIARVLDVPATDFEFGGTGDTGQLFEMMVTGRRGNNKCDADDGLVDVKTLSVVPAPHKPRKTTLLCPWNTTWKIKERSGIRISRLHLQDIQTTSFADSGVFRKSVMLIGVVEWVKGSNVLDLRLVGLKFIDLRLVHKQAEIDYIYSAEQCRLGRADLFSSKQDQPGKILKLYSHETNQPYFDAQGAQCFPKKRKSGAYAGYSFYLFGRQIVDLTK